MDDHKKVCPLEMDQYGARIARNEVEKHNQEIQLAQTAQLQTAETNAFSIRQHFTMTTLTTVVHGHCYCNTNSNAFIVIPYYN